MKVIKRDGSTQEFDQQKIRGAVLAAMSEVRGKIKAVDHETCVVVDRVCKIISVRKSPIDIEHIQDIVETGLMKDHSSVAKAYILYRNKRAELRTLTPDPLAVADYIHAAKYAKYLPLVKRREVYEETVIRSMIMHKDKFPELNKEINGAFQFVLEKKVLPSMRSMQFGGQAIENHNARMYNCSFTLIDRPRVFQEILYLLLCGCGVGFSVQKQHVAKLPKIAEIDEQKVLIHHVEDSIVGWADAIGILFDCYQQGLYFEPCYDLIRPIGAGLKTGGGRAPGHLPLKKLIEKMRSILDNAVGRHLKTLECHDIICHIAEVVLAGGIRRSSLISLFSSDDEEMLTCKTPEHFNYQGLNSQRAMSNNSVVFLRKDTELIDFVNLMAMNRKTYGEPGFMFTDHLDWGMNPCGEVGIDPTIDYGKHTGFGFCNLCEVNVAACVTAEDFFKAAEAAAFIGTLQASYTDFPYLGQITEQIVKRDALLGVGLVGIMDNPELGLHKETLHLVANAVVKENERVAKLININAATRCTVVKPSGTSSLELGCVGSGIHPHHADRYFRRVTANRNEPVAQFFAEHNPHMVEEKPDGDLCITFPVKTPKSAIILDDIDAVEFMDTIFLVYDSWILEGMGDPKVLTHNISATVVVEEGDWSRVLEHAWNNRKKIRAMSFFPKFADKKIPFAPRETVEPADESWWKCLIKNYKPVDYSLMTESSDVVDYVAEPACSAGECDIVHVEAKPQADGSIWVTTFPDPQFYIYEISKASVGGLPLYRAVYRRL